jgi:methionine-rich copper-binding protein CopC
MRALATLMLSITLVTTALFAHALVTADEPAGPVFARVAAR